MQWEIVNGVMMSMMKKNDIEAVAGFNLYGTIIDKDWCFLYPNTKEKLKNISNDGYTVTLFINKPNLIKNNKHKSFMTKLDELRRRLSIQMNIFISTEDDANKKPMTGMWEMSRGTTGFYCGDSAGRKYGRNDKDYGKFDRYFAHNIGLPFFVPEEVFGQPVRKCDIVKYPLLPCVNEQPFPWDELKKELKPRYQKFQIIIMVGCVLPWMKIIADEIVIRYSGNYFIVTNDTDLRLAIEENRNIIYVNRNPKREHIYDNVKHKYNKLVIYFDFPKELCIHLNHYRVQKFKEKKDSFWVYEKYFENLVPPTVDECNVVKLDAGHVLRGLGKEFNYMYDI